jgi:hypothetical protein
MSTDRSGNRPATLVIRLSDAELADFKEVAGFAGQPVSAWARSLLRQKAVHELLTVKRAPRVLAPPAPECRDPEEMHLHRGAGGSS